jgi:acyl carrier protein
MPPPEAVVADKAQAIAFAPSQSVSVPQGGNLSPQVMVPDRVPLEWESRSELSVREESTTSSLVSAAGVFLPVESDIPDREELTARLVAIVSERTGYPSEMLDLDLDLEAELGIDSIKRIEILGTTRNPLITAEDDIAVIMEELAKIKTLRGVIEWVDTRLRGVVAGRLVTWRFGPRARASRRRCLGEIGLMLPEVSAELDASAPRTPPRSCSGIRSRLLSNLYWKEATWRGSP